MEITVRPLKEEEDISAVIQIDSAITGRQRDDYYKRKMAEIFSPGRLSCSLAAEVDGDIAGFLIGQVYEGEFGIPGVAAYIDSLGVWPKYHKLGIGSRLMDQFVSNMKAANVKKIYTLVDFSDIRLIKFFGGQGFYPSKRLSLEMELF